MRNVEHYWNLFHKYKSVNHKGRVPYNNVTVVRSNGGKMLRVASLGVLVFLYVFSQTSLIAKLSAASRSVRSGVPRSLRRGTGTGGYISSSTGTRTSAEGLVATTGTRATGTLKKYGFESF